jgi:replicative DNA helicase Mcm
MSDLDRTILDAINEFYTSYCMDDIAELAQSYPKDSKSLWIDWYDLNKFDSALADDVLNRPDDMLPHFREELKHVELPVDVELSNAQPRFYNLPETHTYAPSKLRNGHGGRYVAVKGTLSRATGSRDVPEKLVFECTSGHTKEMIQFPREKNEPSYCDHCDGTPGWRELTEKGEWTDEAKIQIETPPDESGAIDGDEITGYVRHDLVDHGSEIGIAGRTGETVKASGIVRREERTGRNADDNVYDKYLDVRAVEFDSDEDSVDIEAHKDDFVALANSENPVDLFAESIAPSLYATPEWERALEMGVAYLFAAPRIDIDEATYRGDIHMLIVSDYGMGKSTFNSGIADMSPDCIKKSATGLGSHVGLTATAVQDDSFGDGGWILKPGILVRGNGGHVILDEIDKPDADLTKMNDALEKDQQVSVEKAGKDATFNSRVGLLATANPIEGRFEPHEPIGPQIGIDASLLSRFDGIIAMRDTTDEEVDAKVGETVGKGYQEAQEKQYGDREELEFLDQPVPTDVGKAWVAYARENVHPVMSDEQISELKEWYAEEIRQFNDRHTEEDGEIDPPVPVTARAVEDAIRVSVAFARVNLRETVADEDVERAKDLLKTLAGQNYDSESGYIVNRAQLEAGTPKSQKKRRNGIVQFLNEHGQAKFSEIAEGINLSGDVLESDIDKLMQQGKIYEPQNGVFEAT